MGAYEVIVTPDAERDLREISSYITNVIGERGTAHKQVRAIRQAMSSLSAMPSRIRTIEEQPWSTYGIRKLLEGNYFIYYRIAEDESRVYILNVVFACRGQLRFLQRNR